jgi:hypothetical protein
VATAGRSVQSLVNKISLRRSIRHIVTLKQKQPKTSEIANCLGVLRHQSPPKLSPSVTGKTFLSDSELVLVKIVVNMQLLSSCGQPAIKVLF